MLRSAPLLLMTVAAPAAAQPEEIVVTGRGLARGLGESVFDTVVIDREQLAGSASNRLDEILKQVPGFQLFRRSDARSPIRRARERRCGHWGGMPPAALS
jgi:outer membrane cobalamin receptor